MQPVTLSFKSIADVLRHADAMVVRASCGHCAHVAELDWLALAVAHGETMTLAALGRRMRCTRCGKRGSGWQVVPKPGVGGA